VRRLLAALTIAVLIGYAAPATAATIYTFELTGGAAADPTSIQSFSFDPLGAGGTLTIVKALDSFSPTVFLAVATGEIFDEATFSAFEDVIDPGSRIFEFSLADAMFISVQLSGAEPPLETFSITSPNITITRGPATAPEPATLLLLGTATVAMWCRRRRVSPSETR
jgi:hypothetical protein